MAFSFGGKYRAGNGQGTGGPQQPRFAVLSEVRAYWEGLRVGGALPHRDAIDPRGIAGALEQTFLIERIAPGIARFRLAGMQLTEILGVDVRGMPLSALLDPVGRSKLAAPLEAVFHEPAVMDLWLEAERGIGRPNLEARLLVLPLISTRGVPDLALGCLATEGLIGRGPRRFAIAGVMSETLTVARATAPLRAAVQGLAEAAAPFAAAAEAPRPPRGKPQLRVVRSDD